MHPFYDKLWLFAFNFSLTCFPNFRDFNRQKPIYLGFQPSACFKMKLHHSLNWHFIVHTFIPINTIKQKHIVECSVFPSNFFRYHSHTVTIEMNLPFCLDCKVETGQRSQMIAISIHLSFSWWSVFFNFALRYFHSQLTCSYYGLCALWQIFFLVCKRDFVWASIKYDGVLCFRQLQWFRSISHIICFIIDFRVTLF